ncbi:hypothetical protein MPL1032_60051 [Mesorhizobium plurifarium]|uniref:Uncharacterized protein n=1 Tax=Mesorhizobium plurifarium TaxID=69974 RepID=A0A0K2W5X7_MESPL|nr:hypothetical protein MPL1032_60051 [Mesorhizobium plurifarium]
MHMLVLLEARVAMGLLCAVAIQAHKPAGERLLLSLGLQDREARFLRHLRLRHLHRNA